MAEKILMPQLGASMESGTIVKWIKAQGEEVRIGEPLFEVETDKTTIEVEADVGGTLLKILRQVGESVPVQELVAYIGERGEALLEEPSMASAAQQKPPSTMREGATPDDRPVQETQAIGRARATPAARRLAASLGLEISDIRPSSPDGRIEVADVQDFAVQASPTGMPTADSGALIDGEVLELSPMRRAIARRMVESAFTAPHSTLVTEVDMYQAVALREQLLPAILDASGERLSFTEIVLKAVACALLDHPALRSSIQDDRIVVSRSISIGLAVATTAGLIVPVVKDVDQLGLLPLTQECKKLTRLARDGKLRPDQTSGGSFTVTNLGMYAVDAMTPIINQPQCAILAVGRIHDKPVGLNGSIALRPMMTLSLGIDHRIIDGAPAAAFLTGLKQYLEHSTFTA